MIYKRDDFPGNIKSRPASLRKIKRILTLVLLLVLIALPVLAETPLKHAVQSVPNRAGHPVVALIDNPRFGLPEPVGLSLIILSAMLLALAGLHLVGSNQRPQNVLSGVCPPPLATDTTSGSAPIYVREKTCPEPEATLNAYETNNSDTLMARFCKKYNCSSAEFSGQFLQQCLKPQARPWTAFLTGFSGRYFSNDLELIRDVENLSNFRKIKEEVNIFGRYNNLRPRSFSWFFLQHTLGIRLSKRRLVNLSRKLFA